MDMTAVFSISYRCRVALLVVFVAFAGSSSASPDIFLEVTDASQNILDGIETAFGTDFRRRIEANLPGAESELAFTYSALPKNEQQRLSPAAVRYMLNRHLLQRRGWRVKGIDPEGQGYSADSPTMVFKEIAPDVIAGLFERLVSGRGLNLRECSIMLALIEALVNKDSLRRVTKAYEAKGYSVSDTHTLTEIHWALETYLRSVILGPRDAKLMSPRIVQKLWSYNMSNEYPGWLGTIEWLQKIEHNRLVNESAQDETAQEDSRHTFAEVTNVVNEVSEGYGVWQQSECAALKDMMMNLEDPDCPGRVTLARFYNSALHGGRWQLTESLPYLKASGALDETDKEYPRVIIPNYLTSLTNCVAASSFFATCCLDECEPVLGQLEARLGADSASPAEIAAAVVGISTPSQLARDKLPDDLVKHLEDIAREHHGMVPIHGRLFAQWLHMAYPRECSYPHESSTTTPRSHLDWRRETGSGPEASKSEMMFYTETHKLGKTMKARQLGQGPEAPGDLTADDAPRQCFTWTMTEELIATQSQLLLDRLALDKGYILRFAIPSVLLSVFSFFSMNKAWRAQSSSDLFRL